LKPSPIYGSKKYVKTINKNKKKQAAAHEQLREKGLEAWATAGWEAPSAAA
jgi:hypothetical protein